MTLYIIGIGLYNHKDISCRGLDIIKDCDKIYLENYTSLLQCTQKDLEEFYQKKITPAPREQAEQGMSQIIQEAKKNKVAFLVIGDPFSATTHAELFRLAKEEQVNIEVLNNASVLTAVGITGLQLYKFGRTASIPFLERVPNLETPYHIIKQNQEQGLHTLLLLDIVADKNKFMTVKQGIEVLEDIEQRLQENIITANTYAVGCARLGTPNPTIICGTLKDLKEKDFGKQPHCLIIPGKMHFSEEEMLELWHQ